MKIDKKKVVFISIVVIVLIFIFSYSTLIFMKEEAPSELKHPLVPELKEEQKKYTSKLEALDDLKEERERNIPSIYSDRILDSLAAYAPAIEDTVLRPGPESLHAYGKVAIPNELPPIITERDRMDDDFLEVKEEGIPENLSAGHAAFFLTGLKSDVREKGPLANSFKAEIKGTQTVRTGDRLEIILKEDADLNGKTLTKNTLLYGFVSLQQNRLHIKITHVNNQQLGLKAYDLQDSNEGIYVRNSIREEAAREVFDDLVQDISITGFPQVKGIKNIFRRNNRRVKVTVLDQYQLILKPAQ